VTARNTPVLKRIFYVSSGMLFVLTAAAVLGISVGSAGGGFKTVIGSVFGSSPVDTSLQDIIWRIRAPRVLMAALVGAALSCGGLVFQALLRNPLAEPYILGISGGAAIGAIIGILLGFSRFIATAKISICSGITTVRPPMASEPTPRPTKMVSTRLYSDIASIPAVDGMESFSKSLGIFSESRASVCLVCIKVCSIKKQAS